MSHGRGTHEDTLLAVLFSEIDGTFPELFIERSVLSLLWTNAEHAHSVSSLFYFISRNRLPRIWLIFGVRMTECWPSWTSMTTRAAWRQPGAVWDHDEELFLWIPVSVRSVSWESQWKFISLTLTSSWSWTIKGPWRKQNCVLFYHELSMKPSVLWVSCCQVAFIYWKWLDCALMAWFHWL